MTVRINRFSHINKVRCVLILFDIFNRVFTNAVVVNEDGKYPETEPSGKLSLVLHITI